MRRNAAGQKLTVMMRTSNAAIQAVVSLATRTVTGATNATPIVVTTSAAHGMIPGNRVEITGVGGNTAANGTFVVTAVGSTTTFSLGDTTDGTSVAGNGAYTSGGTVTPQSINVFVSKDGGAPTTGAGTLSHIGRGPLHIAHTANDRQFRSSSASAAATVSAAGTTQVTLASGGISSSTYGLWSYTPTASETNAAQVSFTFTSPALNTISITQTFEPTSGPILYQTLLNHDSGAVTNQTTIVLPSANPAPPADDDAFNNAVVVFYDGSTEGQVSACPVADYVGSTRTLTLRAAPTFTVTTSDYVTIFVANNSNLKKNAALAKFAFMMTDSTNHAPATGKTVTVTRSIDGGAFAAGSLSAVTEIGNGMYYVDFAAADLNGNVVILRATAAACDDTFERVISQP